MKYLSHMPQERHILSLARRAEFPISRNDLVQLACRMGFASSTIRFLLLFDNSDTFESGLDLINRCEEMKLLIRDARLSQPELARSADCY